VKGHVLPYPEGTDAQWLLLSAIIVAVGLGALVLLLNMAILSGHSSTQSIMSFPKNEIRDLRYLSVSEAVVIGQGVNADINITDKRIAFDQAFDRFIDETGAFYKLHGALPSISYSPVYNGSLNKITNVSLDIRFYDGTTLYTENTTVGIG
jgi:hypothetical protein